MPAILADSKNNGRNEKKWKTGANNLEMLPKRRCLETHKQKSVYSDNHMQVIIVSTPSIFNILCLLIILKYVHFIHYII